MVIGEPVGGFYYYYSPVGGFYYYYSPVGGFYYYYSHHLLIKDISVQAAVRVCRSRCRSSVQSECAGPRFQQLFKSPRVQVPAVVHKPESPGPSSCSQIGYCILMVFFLFLVLLSHANAALHEVITTEIKSTFQRLINLGEQNLLPTSPPDKIKYNFRDNYRIATKYISFVDSGTEQSTSTTCREDHNSLPYSPTASDDIKTLFELANATSLWVDTDWDFYTGEKINTYTRLRLPTLFPPNRENEIHSGRHAESVTAKWDTPILGLDAQAANACIIIQKLTDDKLGFFFQYKTAECGRSNQEEEEHKRPCQRPFSFPELKAYHSRAQRSKLYHLFHKLLQETWTLLQPIASNHQWPKEETSFVQPYYHLRSISLGSRFGVDDILISFLNLQAVHRYVYSISQRTAHTDIRQELITAVSDFQQKLSTAVTGIKQELGLEDDSASSGSGLEDDSASSASSGIEDNTESSGNDSDVPNLDNPEPTPEEDTVPNPDQPDQRPAPVKPVPDARIQPKLEPEDSTEVKPANIKIKPHQSHIPTVKPANTRAKPHQPHIPTVHLLRISTELQKLKAEQKKLKLQQHLLQAKLGKCHCEAPHKDISSITVTTISCIAALLSCISIVISTVLTIKQKLQPAPTPPSPIHNRTNNPPAPEVPLLHLYQLN